MNAIEKLVEEIIVGNFLSNKRPTFGGKLLKTNCTVYKSKSELTGLI